MIPHSEDGAQLPKVCRPDAFRVTTFREWDKKRNSQRLLSFAAVRQQCYGTPMRYRWIFFALGGIFLIVAIAGTRRHGELHCWRGQRDRRGDFFLPWSFAAKTPPGTAIICFWSAFASFGLRKCQVPGEYCFGNDRKKAKTNHLDPSVKIRRFEIAFPFLFFLSFPQGICFCPFLQIEAA